jgi:cyclopropane-fatty-acyl-phospholipid synthase
MHNTATRVIDWSEQGLVPDTVIRHGIRRLLNKRLDQLHSDDCEHSARLKFDFIEEMNSSPVALLPEKANEQHYEVPAGFFLKVLGQQNKYSCCHWNSSTTNLDSAESNALAITCRRAGLQDGMKILELGCGWGSLTLWMARLFPNSQITAVSNSTSQHDYIMQQAREQHIDNLTVITCDMNDFSTDERYDRIVSIEMFEHMRNYRLLFKRIADWLEPQGKLFMHIFCHRGAPYAFVEKSPADWMSRHFFSGGIMPSDDLPLHFQDQLKIERQWRWDGNHYARTANAWLENMDANRDAIWPILEETYGEHATQQWWMRWRMFFMACAELFAYDNGQQWYVSHYLFENRSGS